MVVVDASAWYEALTSSRYSERVRRRLANEPLLAAPHVIDVEVLGVIRRHHLVGKLDATQAHEVIEALSTWRGLRHDHRPLLERAWQLRDNVRGWDAMYVALAESLEAALITTDARLAQANGPRCRFEVIAA
jgi:predicted nucleic acid-binding protein